MTRQILVGGIPIGGGAPVVIQSMLNTKTTDVEGSLQQIRQLASAGCQIARLAVPNMEAARTFAEICKESPLPLVADIHFSHKLAVAAIENGAHKVRINPGNIGGEEKIRYVADCVKAHKIPVRVGSNTGSIEKHFLEKYGKSAGPKRNEQMAKVADCVICFWDKKSLGTKSMIGFAKEYNKPIRIKIIKT